MFHVEHNNSSLDNQNLMMDCMLSIPPSSTFCISNSFNLAEVMQLEEFGSELALNEAKRCDQENGVDSAKEGRTELNISAENLEKIPTMKAKNKRKRARATKTSEEVEKQRMTHIAVERNRRKQMNEHLQILRSLMPTSYVQRGDQASIVGGAIEFVREMEQLLECLESLKKSHQEPLTFPANDQVEVVEGKARMQDETAESKSWLADVEVKVSGMFGLIKIVSGRRAGQLIRNVAAVQHLQLHILQTNIYSIEHNVVCSFSVKMSEESRLTAEDIANSIQQILSSFHANSSMSTTAES